MKKLVAALTLLSIIFLAACGDSNSTSEGEKDTEVSLKPVKVEFLTESDAFQPGKEGTIKVKVTQGEENVPDADEVLFEIWKKGHKDASKKYEVENVGDGVYSLKHTFEEKGIYTVIAHVTARTMHTMPSQKFNVGAVKEESHAHGDHHSGNNLMVMLMNQDTIQANKEVTLTAHLQKDNKPFTEATVRFEYWQDGKKKHTYIDAKENEKGKYQANVTFKEPGKYTVKIHVRKGELHTHKEETVEVQ